MIARRSFLLACLGAPSLVAARLAAGRAARAGQAETAEERLARTEAKLAEALLERRPWLARERGIDREYRGLGRYGPDGSAWWTALLESAATELAAVDGTALGTVRRVELDWVRAWVETEYTLTYYRALERWDPLAYVERADLVLRSLVEADTEDRIDRAKAIQLVLTELPELWASARRALVTPSEIFSEEGGERLLDLASYLRNDLARLVRRLDAPEMPSLRSRFERVQTVALSETLELRKWLVDNPFQPRSPSASMGAENWQSTVRGLLGGDATPAKLKTRVLRELALLDGELGEGRLLPEVGREELAPREVARRITQGARQALTLATLGGVFERADLGLANLVPRVRLGYGVPRPWAVLRAGEGADFVLEVEIGGDDWSGEVERTRRAVLCPAAQTVLGMRYGFPGEALLRSNALERGSPGQRVLWNRANFEGWGLYVLDWLLRVSWVENPFAADPEVRREVLRARQIEAARFLAALELHAENALPAEAARAFRRRTGFDERSAFYEVRAALHDPLLGVGYLGAAELRRVEAAFAERLEPKEALLETLRVLGEFPSGRPEELVRWIVPTRGVEQPGGQ